MRTVAILSTLVVLLAAGTPQARGQQLDLVVQAGHSETVTAVAFSPDGKILASASRDKRVKLWDVATGLEIKDLGQKESPYFQPSSFSRHSWAETRQVDGKEMFVEYNIVNVLFFSESPISKYIFGRLNPRTQRLIRKQRQQPSLELLSALADDLNEILRGESVHSAERFKDVELSKETKSLLERKPTGERLVRLNRLLLGDAYPDQLQPGRRDVNELIFSHDGKLLVGRRDDDLIIWAIETDSEISIFQNSAKEIAFSPDDKVLAAITWDSITLYDAASGVVLRKLGSRVSRDSSPAALRFSPDGKTLLSIEQYLRWYPREESEKDKDGFFLRYWDMAKGAEISHLSRRVKADTTRKDTRAQTECVSPDGGSLVYEVASMVKDDFGTSQVKYQVNLLNLSDGRDTTIREGFRAPDGLGGLNSSHKKTACQFSPDGRSLALANGETLTLYSAATGEKAKEYPLGFKINQLTFSGDGSRLALANENEIEIFNVREGKVIGAMSNHFQDVFGFFRPDGSLVLERDNGVSQAFDPVTGKQRAEAGKAGLRINQRYTTKRWNISAGVCVASEASEIKESLQSLPRLVLKRGFNPEGTLFALTEQDKVYLIDTKANKVNRILGGHLADVNEAVFSPDGKLLASGSWDRTVKLWDTLTGEEIRTLTGYYTGNGRDTLAFSRDAKLIATRSRNGAVIVWDIATGVAKVTVKHANVLTFAYSPAGDQLATAGEKGVVKLWDLSSGAELFTLGGHTDNVVALAFNDAGDILASGGGDKTIKLWDVRTGREVKTLRGHDRPVVYVEFLSGGELLSESVEFVAEVWDAGSGQQRQTFRGLAKNIVRAALSPDLKTLETEELSSGFKFWDVATGRQVFEIAWTLEGETREAVAPNTPGDYVMTAYGKDRFAVAFLSKVRSGPNDFFRLVNQQKRDSYTLKLWKLNGDSVQSAYSTEVEITEPRQLFFSPDGKWLAISGHRLLLWNTEDRSTILELGDSDYSGIVAISHDSALVAVGERSGLIQIWDRAMRKRVSTLRGHTDTIQNLSFHPEKSLLMSQSDDGTTKLWDVQAEGELGTLIALNEDDWVVVAPDGRFDATPNAMKLMHYVYGLEVITLEQIKDAYYEPGLLTKLMGYGREPLRDIRPLRDVKLYPEVVRQEIQPDSTTLVIGLKNRGGGIGAVSVLVNGKTIMDDARDARLRGDPSVKSATLRIDLRGSTFVAGTQNQVTVVTSNYDPQTQQSYINSRGATIVFTPMGEKNLEPPRLFAIVGGISDYAGNALDLRFAAKDAEDFATALRAGANRFFGADKVSIKVLSTTGREGTVWPSKKNFKEAFAEVAKTAKPEDVLVIYLAGHGVSAGLNTDSYYYLTQEAQSASKESLSNPDVRGTTAISSTDLTNWLTNTEWVKGEKGVKPLKQVMILDTCAAGTIAGQVSLMTRRNLSGDQIRAIERLKDRTGFHILMGSAADAVSYEATQYGQGLLTYALLQAMRGAKLREGEFADVSELFQYAADEVPRLARDIGGIQKPIVAAPLGASFDIGRFTGEEQRRVPLSRVMPFILRPRLINPEQGFDELELEASLRKSLRESNYAAAHGPSARTAGYVFIDTDEMPGALRPSGTYVIRGNVVTVTLNLIRDGKKLASFQTTGDKASVSTLADKLTSGVANVLNNLP